MPFSETGSNFESLRVLGNSVYIRLPRTRILDISGFDSNRASYGVFFIVLLYVLFRINATDSNIYGHNIYGISLLYIIALAYAAKVLLYLSAIPFYSGKYEEIYLYIIPFSIVNSIYLALINSLALSSLIRAIL
jgi:hypothetical protein